MGLHNASSGSPTFSPATPDFPYRWLCVMCQDRYGEASPDGFIDITTCENCLNKGLRNVDKCQKSLTASKWGKRMDWR